MLREKAEELERDYREKGIEMKIKVKREKVRIEKEWYRRESGKLMKCREGGIKEMEKKEDKQKEKYREGRMWK